METRKCWWNPLQTHDLRTAHHHHIQIYLAINYHRQLLDPDDQWKKWCLHWTSNIHHSRINVEALYHSALRLFHFPWFLASCRNQWAMMDSFKMKFSNQLLDKSGIVNYKRNSKTKNSAIFKLINRLHIFIFWSSNFLKENNLKQTFQIFYIVRNKKDPVSIAKIVDVAFSNDHKTIGFNSFPSFLYFSYNMNIEHIVFT